MNKISYGLFGGTFDPIHLGHLLNAELAAEYLKLDLLYFIPAFIPPHKQTMKITPWFHRLKMVEMSCLTNTRFKVLSSEIERHEVSYTVETLRELRHAWGKSAGIYFIMGSDSFQEILSWKDPGEISSLAKIAIIKRHPNFCLSEVDKNIFKVLKPNSVLEVPGKMIEISASEIRKRVGLGLSIKYLVTPEVEEYIYLNKLYR